MGNYHRTCQLSLEIVRTEKNLHKVSARAEALDVILLLGEGDTLLRQRTDVKSSNDRYAKLETNYLPQRVHGALPQKCRNARVSIG